MSDLSAIDQIKDFVFGLGYEAENDEIADAVLAVEARLDALEAENAKLRDAIPSLLGFALALEEGKEDPIVGLIAAGAGLSWFVSPTLAVASAAAFAASEVIGLAVFAVLGGNRGGPPQLLKGNGSEAAWL